jgi:DegV family protein with EDD domain
MIIVTNPGSNVTQKYREHYGIELAPQQIVVDKVFHDTRQAVALTEVDEWIRTAATHPHVLGTSAAEFTNIFKTLSQKDKELLVVMTSRKIIQSYYAATSAAESLVSHPHFGDVRIQIVDSTVTDGGAALLCLLAGEAMKNGHTLGDTVKLLEVASTQIRVVLIPENFDNLVKGGRASFLKAFVANLFGIRPVISFVDGELKPVSKVSAKQDMALVAIEEILKIVPQGQPVWVAVSHGDDLVKGRAVMGGLRRHYQLEYGYVQPFSSSIYLHVGRGSLGLFVLPLGKLPWRPTTTPPPIL